VLEKLANEAAGAWILAKVDVDSNPKLGAALQVQSIPMVVAVIGGQLVDGFLGVLPEAQVRGWIGQILGVAAQLGLDAKGAAPGEGGPPDLNGAANALDQILQDTPGHPVAKVWLAQVELFRRVNSYDQAKVHQAARENPDDADAQANAADLELADGQIDAAFDRLLGVISRTAGADRDKARLHLLSLFDIMPPRDPKVTKARGRLSSMLF
jgi:putative thioredoxin